jgi:putative membrane-bound dehydrogenase-like protein
MIFRFLPLALLAIGMASAAAGPLRVFIRSGPKTHGPGAHDHPAFLREWTTLLNERGAKATGGDTFPTAEQLAETDVLILNAPNAGDIQGPDRANLEAWLARGGGIVAIHAAAVSRDHDWFKTVIGGSWKHGQTRWLEGHMSVYFTDRENPVTRDCSNFDLDDEIYYDMELLPDIQVLAAAYTPNPRDGRAADAPAHAGLQQVSVYDIQPQIWKYQSPHHRAFVMLPGHLHASFSHNSIRTVLLRGIAWAGGRENPDEFIKPDELGDALRYPANGPLRPDLAAEKIEIHPEFDLSLVASEPLIQKVMNIDWDEKGRMWVAETPEYPNGLRRSNVEAWKDTGALSPGNYDRDPTDRISILTDTDGDGRMDQKQIFADKLELVTSFVLHKNGVIAAAAPHIWWLEDTDGDQVADKRTQLYTGLGTGDTHAVINNLRWGLDGWIYATHGYSSGKVTAAKGPHDQTPVAIGSGVVRFLPDGTKFEQYSSKGGNTWGLDVTWQGEVFWTQPTSGTVFFHTLLPESVLAKAKLPDATGWKGMISRQKTYPLMKWEQQAYRQIDQVGQFTAAAGCAIYEGGAWPERWNRSYFTGEPTINIVSHFFTRPDGPSVTPAKESGREETEFIRSRDLWFRPIETRIGPDGALFVIDFYNQAVIHNDTRGPRHGPANAAVRPDRDHYFGRIWRIQHRQAKDLGPFHLDRNDTAALLTVIHESPNGPRKHIAWRLLRETGAAAKHPDLAESIATRQGGRIHRLYQTLSAPETAAKRGEILDRFAAATDPWTRTALVAAASNAAADMVIEAMASSHAATLAPLVGELAAHALRTGTPEDAKRLLIAAANAPAAAAPLQALVLDALAAAPELAAPLDDALAKAFARLLDGAETATTTLPILAAWDRGGKLAALAKEKSLTLARTLADPEAPAETRIKAGRALARLGDDGPLIAVLTAPEGPATDPEIQREWIETLSANQLAGSLVPVFAKLAETVRPAAYDAILKRSDSSLALLKALEDGTLPAGLLGPGDLARLRSHPDKQVSRGALALLDSLVPGAKERAGIIAQLTPEVSKPGGDPARGKVLFSAACATCHTYEDLGRIEVGPPLTGMGAHGPAELLVHIVDPNREVDPSFWQWNVTTRSGDIHAGVIVSENAQTLTLRNAGGDVTLRKADIATRENTHRSFMPEGLHGLGADGLRDILAFMTGSDARHRVIDLRDAFTADGRRGLFRSEQAVLDTITPKRFGNVTFNDIPFFLMDPARSREGLNLIVLKGGRGNDLATNHPQRVEIPLGFTASRVHLLSGVAGWGFPATSDKRVALKVTIHRADGSAKVFDLANGAAFADYNRPIDVPGSESLPDATTHGQLRLITLELENATNVKSITLESLDNGLSPVVAAITAETRNDP